MHENREISSTPWSDEQGRSAKATSRTADMYVPEKSDCAVLPVNQPNKGGQLSAEAGEGRAQTRENIAQLHMHPTQSGKRMSQGLDGVRKAAKERKQERFTALLHHLNHPQFCGPDTTYIDPSLGITHENSNFGKIFYTCNAPREVQMALKLYW